ncbi:MAG: D-glycero-alpha-D-manno-heptose-1,7-bisphosphate 7-phosphatase [Mariprofundaceae bacterium]
MKNRPIAVLLDRDGVINVDSPDYILSPDAWWPVPGSLEAIARLGAAAIPVAIVSNQSALGRGMIDQDMFGTIHTRMMTAIAEAGGHIAHAAYCPHAPDHGCYCRKPEPGLVFEALKKLGLEDQASSVLLIGDSIRDVQAAVSAGVKPALVRTGYGDANTIYRQATKIEPGIPIYPDLRTATDIILERPC